MFRTRLVRRKAERTIKGRNVRAALMAFALAATFATAATASALLSVRPYTPTNHSATQVQGKVDVRGSCQGYVRCSFHSSLERSSWRGWQTVSGSIVNQRLGVQYPTASKLSGWYDYKSHFHADVTQWGLCEGEHGGWYSCLKSGTQRLDSAKIRLHR